MIVYHPAGISHKNRYLEQSREDNHDGCSVVRVEGLLGSCQKSLYLTSSAAGLHRKKKSQPQQFMQLLRILRVQTKLEPCRVLHTRRRHPTTNQTGGASIYKFPIKIITLKQIDFATRLPQFQSLWLLTYLAAVSAVRQMSKSSFFLWALRI